MKEGASRTQWFVDSQKMAIDIYTRGSNISIASPIYPAPQNERSQSLINERFPYRQIIRGNGACYLNACLVGILNKCVNDEVKWKKFKVNIYAFANKSNEESRIKEIIDQIELETKAESGNFLDRSKLNAMLQVRGNVNLCTQLARFILIPKHQELIDAYKKKIEDLDVAISELESRFSSAQDGERRSEINYLIDQNNRFKQIHEAYQKNISSANPGDFASSYEEVMIFPYVNELTKGMGDNEQSLEIVTIANHHLDNIGFLTMPERNSIYLYNQSGNAHFDLWYSNQDPICNEINPQILRIVETKSRKDLSDAKRREELTREINELKELGDSNINVDLINEILDVKEFGEFLETGNLENLELIKSIYEASANQASASIVKEGLKETLTRGGSSSPKLDEKACYALALEEIDGNDQPSEHFWAYLRGVNSEDNQQRHLAQVVAMRGKIPFIKPLIEFWPECFKVKDNFMDFDNTPLLWAIANAKNEFASQLLSKVEDLDINFKSERFCNTALHIAVAKDYGDIDSDSHKVGIPNHQLVGELISKGANPNIKTQDGYSALDIAVLRGSQQMCKEILASKLLEDDTISKALGHLEEQRDLDETNRLLKTICDPIKAVKDKDISSENKEAIKKILNDKLQELAPAISLKKALKESIVQVISRAEYEESRDKTKQYLLEISGEDRTLQKICKEVYEEKFKEKFAIEAQDSNFVADYDNGNKIIKFRTISPDNIDAKFNYNKMLSERENYDSANYSKEKEQQKILEMLKKARDKTYQKFSEVGIEIDNNFFIAVMKVASENRGIARINTEKFNDDFDKALNEIDPTLAKENNHCEGSKLHEIAKFFSANFQIMSKQENYLTARQGVDGKINQTGRRLFRVCTQENIQKFQQSLKPNLRWSRQLVTKLRLNIAGYSPSDGAGR